MKVLIWAYHQGECSVKFPEYFLYVYLFLFVIVNGCMHTYIEPYMYVRIELWYSSPNSASSLYLCMNSL